MPAIRTSVPAVHFALVSNAAITLNSTQSDSLQLALSGASNRIRTFLARADRRTALAGVFGSAGTAATTFNTKVTNLLSVIGSPGLGLQVELRSAADMNGAAVAYAASSPSGGPRVYLNADLLSDGTSSDLISWLLLEAAGHNLDSRLNGVRDTAGDEGKAFAALLTGRTLSDSEMGVYGRDPAGGVVMVNGVAVVVECEANKSPTASATALNGSFSEGQGLANQGAAVKVFSNAAISVGAANETWQTIKALRLTVSGLRDGSDETITVDGTSIRFGANSSGTTASNGLSYSVTIANGVATLNLSKAAGIRAAAANALLNGLSYQNTNRDNPSAGARTITLTSLSDSGSTAVSGGTANGANNTSTPNLTSTITVVAVNDAPQLGSLASIALVDTSAADQFTATSGTLNATDPEGAALSYGLTDAIAANKSIDGLSYDLSKAGAYGTLYLNSGNGNYRFQPNSDWSLNALSVSGSDSFNLSVSDGSTSTSTALLINFTGSSEAPEQYVVIDDASPVLTAAAQALWEQALTLASRYLSELLTDPFRDAILADVFGRAGTDAATFEANKQALLASIGGPGLQIDIDLRTDAELNGAAAAYAAIGHTGKERIYVNGDLINSGQLTLALLTSALLEEYGHALDPRLNGAVDSPGDEGQLFAAEVTGVVLSADQRAVIDAENDSATLTIEGVQVAVECDDIVGLSSLSFGNDTGSSSTDLIVNAASQTMSATVTVNNNNGNAIRLWYSIGSTGTRTEITSYLSSTALQNGAGTRSINLVDAPITLSTGTNSIFFWNSSTGTNNGTAFTGTSSFQYTLDSTAPSSSLSIITLDLAAASDTGSSTTDNLTNITTPVITVSSLAGVTMAVGDLIQIIDTSNSSTVVGSYAVVAGDLTSGAWNGTTKNITLSTALTEGLHELAVCLGDVAGNAGTQSTSLLAVQIDSSAPTLTSQYPANAATGINRNSLIVLTFSESMVAKGGTVTIQANTTNTEIFTLTANATSGTSNVAGGTWTLNGSTLVLDLGTTLVASTIYNVDITSTALTDTAGNAYAGLTSTNATNFFFTTGTGSDSTAPTISNFTSTTANGSYAVGSSINITATASEQLVAGSQFTATLDTGATVVLTAATTGSSLTGTYVVAANQSSSDLNVSSIAVDTGINAPRDLAGNTLSTTIPTTGASSLAGAKAIVIDGITPTISSVVITGADSNLAVGEKISVTVNTSENITVVTTGGTPYFSIDVGGVTEQATYVSGTGTSALLFQYTIAAGDTDSSGGITAAADALTLNNGTLKDAAGNNLTLTSSAITADTNTIAVDGTAPTISSVAITGPDSNLAVGQKITVTVNTSENITVVTAGGTPYFSIVVGSATKQAAYVSGSGSSALVFEYTVAAGDTDTSGGITALANALTLNSGTLKDAAGNNLTLTSAAITANTNSIAVDGTAPTITVTDNSTGTVLIGQDITFTLTFSEPVTGFAVSDITVGNGTKGTFTAVSATVYTLVVTPTASSSGNVTIDVAANAATDAAGNGNTAPAQFTQAFDTLAPTISSVVITGADSNLAVGEKISVTVNTSENITVVTTNGTPYFLIDVGGVTEQATYVSGTGTSALLFQYTIAAGDTDSSGGITAAADALTLNNGTLKDAAGNNLTLTSSAIAAGTNTIAVDGTAPTISSVAITGPDSNLAVGQKITVTVNTSENITVVTAGGTPYFSIVVGSATKQAAYVSGSGSSALVFEYTVAAGDTDTSGGITALANALTLNSGTLKDAAGNNLTLTSAAIAADTNSIAVDGTAPTLTSQYPANAATSINRNSLIVLTFSESMVAKGGTVTIQANTTNTEIFTLTANATSGTSNVAGGTWTLNGSTLVLDLGTTLVASTIYNVDITSTALTDTAGNAYAGLTSTNATNFFFTTGTGSDSTAPTISNFTSTTANGSYAVGSSINITATASEQLVAGSQFTATLDTGATVVLTAATTGSSLTGTYVVAANQSSSDLNVSSIAVDTGINAPRDLAGNTLSTTIPTTGASSLAGAKAIVIDGITPTISSVVITGADSNLAVGEKISVTVNTSENITVVTTGGTPYFSIDVGGVTEQATYVSGTGTSALLFQYTIAAGDTDSSGGITAAADALTLNNGTLKDAAGNNLTLTSSAITADTNTIAVDGTAPTISSVAITGPDSNLAVGQKITVTVNTSENITVVTAGGTPYFSIVVGSATKQAAYVSGSGSSALVFEYTVAAGDTDTSGGITALANALTLNSGTLKDAAGNNLTLTSAAITANTNSIAVDGTAPTITVTDNSTGTVLIGQDITFTLTFSEPVTGFAVSDITVGNGTKGTFTAVSATVYTLVVTPTASSSGNVTIDVAANAATDAAGNGNTAPAQFTQAFDTLAPTISSVVITGADSNLAVGEKISVTVNTSENITVVTTNGTPYFLIDVGGVTEQATYVSGTGTSALLFQYTIAAGDTDSSGGITAAADALTLNNGTLKDAAGNNLTLTSSAIAAGTNTIAVDGTAPTISSVAITGPDSNLAVGQKITVTVNTSENITVVTAGGTPYFSIVVGSATKQAAYVSGSGSSALVFEYTVAAGDTDTSGGITALANALTLNSGTLKDAAGNNLTLTSAAIAADTNSIAVDGTAPTLTSQYPANAATSINRNSLIVLTFSESMVAKGGTVTIQANTTNTEIFTLTANATSGTSNVAGGTWTLNGSTLVLDLGTTLVASTIYNVDITSTALTDTAGNAYAGLTSTNATNFFFTTGTGSDSTAPTISSFTSTTANGSYAVGSSINITATASEQLVAGSQFTATLDTGATVVLTAATTGSSLTGTYVVAANQSSSDLNVSSIAVGTGINAPRDLAGNTLSTTIPTTGASSLAGAKAIVIDGITPTISSVVITGADSNLAVGEKISVTVNTSENITVVTTNGTPYFLIDVGGVTEQATYVSGTGTSALLFQYTIAAGDTDSSGGITAAADALTLNNGTLKDAAGNNLTLTSSAITADTNTIAVDGTAPTISSVAITGPDSNLAVGQKITVTVNTSENITVVTAGGTPYFSIVVGSATKQAAYVSGSGSSALVFEYTVAAGDTDTSGGITALANALTLNSGTLKDAAGNNLTLTSAAITANTNSIAVDGTAPTITVTDNSTGTVLIGQDITFTLTFSEPVTGFAVSDITVGNGTKGTFTAVSATVYTLVVTPTASSSGNVTIDVAANAATDAAGNGNTAPAQFTQAFDTLAPTISSVVITGADSNLAVGEKISVTVNTSENITVVTTNGTPYFLIDVGGVTEQATYVSGTGTSALLFQYTIAAGDTDSSGGITAAADALTLNNGTLKDAAGNNLTLTSSAIAAGTNTIAVDGTAPTISSVAITGPDSNLAVGQKITVTVNTSENITVVTAGGTPYFSIVVGSATKQAAYVSGSGSSALVFEYTVAAGDTDTSGGITALANALTLNSGTLKDAAGNNLTLTSAAIAADTNSIAVDGTAPTLTSQYPANAATSINRNSLIVLTFSESMVAKGGTVTIQANTTNTEIFTLTANATSGTSNVAGGTWTLNGSTLVLDLGTTLVASTIYNVDITSTALTDTAGNAYAGLTSTNATNFFFTTGTGSDSTAPTISSFTSTTANGSYAVGSSINITATASEQLVAGSQFTATLDTGATVVLTAATTGSSLTGTYVVAANQSSSDLNVSSIAVGTGINAPRDLAGNTLSTTIPTTGASSLAGAKAIVVDTTPPITTAAVTALTDNHGTVTGAIASGGLTDDTSGLVVSGTLGGSTAGASLAAGETLRIYDSATYLGNATVTVNTGGQSTWTFTDNRNFTNAQALSYTAQVADAALNLSTAGTAYTATSYLGLLRSDAAQAGTLNASDISGGYTISIGGFNNSSWGADALIAAKDESGNLLYWQTVQSAAGTSVTITAASLGSYQGSLSFSIYQGTTYNNVNANSGAYSGSTKSYPGTTNPFLVIFADQDYVFSYHSTATSISGNTTVSTATTADGLAASGTAASTFTTYTLDTLAPTLAITSNVSTLKAGETATLTFTLSEASTDFTSADINATGGSLSNFAGSGTAYTATFTPAANSTANGVISVASDAFADAAGNTNNDGGDANNTVTLTVDTIRPTIAIASNVSTLKAGETATLTFTLSEASTDFTSADINATGGSLSNFAGSGTSYTVTFTPAANSTANGVISVASDAFADAAGNTNNDGGDANNTVTLTVDTIRPTIAIASNVSTLKAGETATLTFTLSEASTDFTSADINATGGSLSNFAGSGTSYTATFTPAANSTANGVISVASDAFADAAGNTNNDGGDANNTVTLTVDTIRPTIAIASNVSTLKAGETATITFTLSEASTDFTSTDVSVTGGSLSNFAGSGTAYTATFTPTANSTANGVISVASAAFADAAGNTNNDGGDANNTVTLTVDTIRPTIAIASNVSTLKAGETATITFTLSEASTDFTSADVSVTGGSLSNFVGSGTAYTATFTPTADSTANGVISVASSTFSDAAGNTNNDGGDANNTVTLTVDTIRPTVAISSNVSTLKAGETATLTFTLSEASTDFTSADVSVTGGTISNFAGSGTSYTATFTPAANSTANGVISVASDAFADAAGNTNNDGGDANNTVTLTVDTIRPTIAIASDVSTLKAGETATLTFTLSEASTDFTSADINATGGSLSNFSGSGTSYTATFTPAANSTANGVISVASDAFADAAGNTNNDGGDANNTVTLTVDTIRPTIAIASNVSTLKAGETATLTFTLSEASTDFTSADINATGGSLSNFAGSGTAYTATFTPAANSTANGVISVASDAFADAAGNTNNDGGDANNTVTLTVDTIRPTVTITNSDPNTVNITGTAVTFTFTFSEPVTGFSAASITVSNGTPGTFSSISSTVYTLVVTPNPSSSGNVTVDVAASAATDSAGNGNIAPQQYLQAFDTLAPSVTITDNNSGTAKIGQDITFTFTFSEPVTGFSAAGITVGNGTPGTFSTVSSSVYTLVVTPNSSSSGNVTVDVAASAATDAAGNGNIGPQQYLQGFDTTAPNTPQLSLGYGVANGATSAEATAATGVISLTAETGSSVSVTFTGTSGTVTKTVTGNGATAVAIVLSPSDLNTLGNGNVSVSATATDAAGNTSSAGTVDFTLDTVAPSVAITSIGAGDSIVSSLSNDNTVVGTAEPSRTVSIYSGATLLGTTTADGSGNFAYPLTAANITTLGQGSGKSITASQTDAAGNTGTSSAFPFSVDTLAPTLAINTIFTDGYLNDAEDELTQTISGTSTGADGRSVTVNVGGDSSTATIANGGAWSIQLTSAQLKAYTEGRITVSANVADQAGNPASQANGSFIVDRTPLAAPVIAASTITGVKATLVITADPGARLNIYSSLDGGPATLLSAAINNLVPSSGRYSFTTAELADGSYSLTVTSIDVAGNESTPSTALPILIAPPATPTVTFTDTGVSGNDGITSNGVFSVGNITSGNSWQYSTNGGSTWLNGNSATNSFTLLPGSYGTGQLRVRQVDTNGKQGNSYTNPASITIDVAAPLVSISAIKTSLGLVNNGTEAESTTLTFSFSEATNISTAADLSAALAALVNVSAGTLTPVTPVAVNGNDVTAIYTPPIDFVGSASINVASGRFTDLAGNVNVDGSDTNNTISFSLDTLRASSEPVVSISASSGRLKIGQTATLTFTFTQTPSDFAIGDIAVNSGSITGLAATSDPKVWTAQYTPAEAAQVTADISVATGSFGVNGNAGAGTNKNSASISINVDTLAPAEVDSVAFSADTGLSNVDLITNQANQTVTGTVDGTLSNTVAFSDIVRISIDNGATWRLATVIDTAAGVRRGFSLSNVTLTGSSIIQARVEDDAGNISETYSQPYTYDPITYTGELVLSAYGDGVSGNIDSTIRTASGKDNSFSLTLPNKESGANDSYEISTNGGITWSSTTSSQSGLADGTYLYRGSVTDTAGNTATSHIWTVVVDNTPPPSPSITLQRVDGSVNVTALELTSGAGIIRFSAEAGSSVQLSFTSDATGSTGFTKTVLAGGSAQAVVLSSTETAMLRGTAAATGNYTVTVDGRAVDAAGNQSPSMGTPLSFAYTPNPVIILGELSVAVPDGGDGSEAGPTDSIFRITRSGDTTNAVTVTYLLSGNTVAGTDYNYASGSGYATNGYGSITIPAGSSSADVILPTIDNITPDPTREIRLTLRSVSGYTISSTAGYDTAVLTDNDAPFVPELSVSDVSVVEGNSGTKVVTFTMKLSQATSAAVSFGYQFRSGTATLGTDFTSSSSNSGTLTIPATGTQITLTAVVSGDTDVESDESFYLDLSQANGVVFKGGTSTLTATATIINDDSSAQVDPNLGVTITSSGDFTGTAKDDILTGDSGINRIDALDGADKITGGLSADLLFSGNGADQFIYSSFSESCLAFGVDTTDASFTNGDRVVLATRPSALWNVGSISSTTATSLAGALGIAMADKDILTSRSQALASGEAVMFTWGPTSRTQRTYLAVADSNTGDNTNDFLILTPLGQNAIGSLSVQSFFA